MSTKSVSDGESGQVKGGKKQVAVPEVSERDLEDGRVVQFTIHVREETKQETST
jgi:hypothetical protein